MNRTNETFTCTRCPLTGQVCLQGHALLTRLTQAIEAAGASLDEAFQMDGSANVEGCGQPCRLLWRGERDAAWVFGQVTEKDEMDALIAAQKAGHQAPGAMIATRARVSGSAPN